MTAEDLTDAELALLTARQRTVVLRRRRGHTWRRVCRDLEVSEAAAKALLRRAVERAGRARE